MTSTAANPVRAVLRLALLAAWIILLYPFQCLAVMLSRRHLAYILPRLWHRGACRIMGLRRVIEGAPATNGQTLFVCNHVSYLDIPILGSVLKASFVAKQDVARWPVFGTLARLQQTAFVDRSRHAAHHGRDSLMAMVEDGRSLILFPEGTSTDGSDVLPFKSSFFSIACDNGLKTPLSIQPVSLKLEAVNNRPVETKGQRDLYAWYGDMDLAPHLWQIACQRSVTVRVVFHPVLNAASGDRKDIARISHQTVRLKIAA